MKLRDHPNGVEFVHDDGRPAIRIRILYDDLKWGTGLHVGTGKDGVTLRVTPKGRKVNVHPDFPGGYADA